MMREKPAAAHSGAEAFVETLNTLGVDGFLLQPWIRSAPSYGNHSKVQGIRAKGAPDCPLPT